MDRARLSPIRVLIGCWLLCLVANAANPPAAKTSAPEVYSGKIMALSGPLVGTPTDLAVVVARSSTFEELQTFEKTLQEKEGQNKLADFLDKSYDVGAYRLNTELALSVKMITIQQVGKVREYFLVAVRLPQGLEMKGKMTPRDYRFVVIKMKIAANGTGEGSYLSSVKLRFNDKQMPEVDDYQTQPANITGLATVHR